MISAEVHQDGGDSSDLWFEMSMKAVTEVQEIIDYTKNTKTKTQMFRLVKFLE